MPGFSTRAIRAASRVPDAPQPPVNVPIYQTATFEVADASELAGLLSFERAGHSYTRYSNPTHAALEAAVAELEGAEAGARDRLGHGGHPCARDVGAEQRRRHRHPASRVRGHGRADGLGAPSGPGSSIGRSTRPTWPQVEAAIGPRTRLLWLETISNPTTAVADIAALAEPGPRSRRPGRRGQHVCVAGPRQPARARAPTSWCTR